MISGPGVLGNILAAVADGMADLDNRGQPGPYALFLSPERYAQTFAPVRAGELRTPGDQINRMVTGGFYMVNSLAVRRLSELLGSSQPILEFCSHLAASPPKSFSGPTQRQPSHPRMRKATIIFECSSEFRWWCKTEGRSKPSNSRSKPLPRA